MKKLKYMLFIFLTVLLVAVFAILPQAVALLQDKATHSEVKYANTQAIQLSFKEGTQTEQRSMVGKIKLSQQQMYRISENMTSMSKEEVLDSVDRELVPYLEADMFASDWENADKIIEPFCALDLEDGYGFFWYVTFQKDDGYNSLYLWVDDETGKIIFISYQCSGDSPLYDDKVYTWLMEHLSSSFFGALEIEPVDMYRLKDADAKTAVRYTFNDSVYGELIADLHLRPDGFEVSFPTENTAEQGITQTEING